MSTQVSGDHLPYKYVDAPPPNWDTIQPMTGSHIPGVDTGARNGQTTFMGSGGPQTISSGMGSFGGGFGGGAMGETRFGASGGNGASGGRDSTQSLQQTIDQFDANQQAQTAAFAQTLSGQTGQQALTSVNASGLGQFNQDYANTPDPYYYPGSVGELTRGIQYDANGMGVGAGMGGNSVAATADPSPGFTSPLDAQIKDNTGWYDYARGWVTYAGQTPSAASALDYPTINAAIDAYNAAAMTDPGTPEFSARWQTATDAIKTMVTVNGWTYGPPAGQATAGPATLAKINVTPTPGELAHAGLSPQGPGSAYGPLDDLRGLGNAVASGLANVDRVIAHFNGVVNDELVDQGAQDLRDGNQAGFVWNGIKYSFYNTFMPNSVEGAAVGLAGGAAIGKGVGLAAKGATELWPILGRRIGRVAGDTGGLDGQAIRNATQAQVSGGYRPDEWTMTTLRKGDVVYGGLPGQSAFYTDRETLMNGHYGQKSVFESIQSRPHGKFGYRPGMGVYEVTGDVRAPTGKALANTAYGKGGGRQFYIQNYRHDLRLIGRAPLEK